MVENRLDNNVEFAKECIRRGRTLFTDELKHVVDELNRLEKENAKLKKELNNVKEK